MRPIDRERPGCAEQNSSPMHSTVNLRAMISAGDHVLATRAADLIEGTMTTSQTQPGGVVCRYCGLASGVSHATACECVNALLSERNRLREYVLRQERAADKPAPNPTSVRDSTVAPRVALAR
jgi:hypothetical protein